MKLDELKISEEEAELLTKLITENAVILRYLPNFKNSSFPKGVICIYRFLVRTEETLVTNEDGKLEVKGKPELIIESLASIEPWIGYNNSSLLNKLLDLTE